MTSTDFGAGPRVPDEGSSHNDDWQFRESYARRRLVIEKLRSLDAHEMQREKTLVRFTAVAAVISTISLLILTVFAYSSVFLSDGSGVESWTVFLTVGSALMTASGAIVQLRSGIRARRSAYETAASTFQRELTEAWDDVDIARTELDRLQPRMGAVNPAAGPATGEQN